MNSELQYFPRQSTIMEGVTETTADAEFQAVPKRKAAKRKSSPEDVPEAGDSSSMEVEAPARPSFPPVKREKLANGIEIRKIAVPAHRYSPLKENWMKIFSPVVEHLHLQIRFNLKIRQVSN